jgi:hypothetical protein
LLFPAALAPAKPLSNLLDCRETVSKQVRQARAYLRRRYSENSLANRIYPPGVVDDDKITPFALRKRQLIVGESGGKAPATIGAVEAFANGLKYLPNIDAQTAGLLFLRTKGSVFNDAGVVGAYRG